ncbi:MAG: hypothetical protein AAGU06_01895 [Candidatus Shapirobacteria bacterium]
MYTKDFIKDVFIKEIEQMTIDTSGNRVHSYIGFSLVCQCIEVLGACFDKYDWESEKLSKRRFRRAIKELFPEKYKQFNNENNKYDLYKNLRCPMIHQMRPGKYIALSERIHEQEARKSNLHLTILNSGQLILIYEDFLYDFIKACKKLINLIESGNIKTNKILSENISVRNIN